MIYSNSLEMLGLEKKIFFMKKVTDNTTDCDVEKVKFSDKKAEKKSNRRNGRADECC